MHPGPLLDLVLYESVRQSGQVASAARIRLRSNSAIKESGDISESALIVKRSVSALPSFGCRSQLGCRRIGVISSLSKQQEVVRVTCRNHITNREGSCPTSRSRLPLRLFRPLCRIFVRLVVGEHPVRRFG